MSRPGVTYLEVAEAASYLIGQNRNPTIEQIRLILGSGSSTTIANYLKQWKEAQQSTHLLATKENIPQELIAVLKGLWERVLDHSAEKTSAVEENFQTKLNELQQELKKYKTNNRRWQQLYNIWLQDKEQWLLEKLTQEKTIARLNDENIALRAKQENQLQQLQDKQQLINELQQLQFKIQTQLEQDREEYLRQQQQATQQQQQLRMENKIWQEQTTEIKQQHRLLLQSNEVLEKNYRQKIKLCEKQNAELVALEKIKNASLQTSQHWQQQYHELRKNLEDKTTQFVEIQTEVKVVKQQLVTLKQLLDEALGHNKSLEQEKWLLIQEKSQLQGQLQQLEKIKIADTV